MSELNQEIDRLRREHSDVVEARLSAVGKVKRVAAALDQLARALNTHPDFEAVSRDSIGRRAKTAEPLATMLPPVG